MGRDRETPQGTAGGAYLTGAVFGLCVVLGTFFIGGGGEAAPPAQPSSLTTPVPDPR
ncbi:hypothetical protein [Corynebacterium halotolerans]|uniref:hypothetical protein n=1 Tax=Corynebacterium halotolerans TaxID=225326 RepID=UPI00034CEA4D|nr:hypothetical protein [Corynebacterium halotolerans]